MDVETQDKSGLSRSEKAIQEAIQEIENTLIRALSGTMKPALFILLLTVRDGLKELLELRVLKMEENGSKKERAV